MNKRNLLVVISLLLLVAMSTFVLGCPRGPQQRPENQQQQQEPRGELREEPTISLFINETGEKVDIKLEEYLQGVVAAEMEPTWPIDALAAQAIIARTYTLENIQAGRVRELHGTDASTSIEEFQAYNRERINDNVRQAVAKTRGEVATHNGEYIKAWFFADAGGKTATAKEGLDYTQEPTPYIQVVEDRGIEIGPEENRSWTYEASKSEVRQAVQQRTGQDPGNFTSIEIVEKGPSGRAQRVRVGNVEISGPALRLAIGSTKVRSMLLDSLSVQGNKVVFKGKGFGHGVGMSQWGANYLAQQGNSPEDIVRYYFKDVEIKKLWE